MLTPNLLSIISKEATKDKDKSGDTAKTSPTATGSPLTGWQTTIEPEESG
jgi:hypothetical protein